VKQLLKRAGTLTLLFAVMCSILVSCRTQPEPAPPEPEPAPEQTEPEPAEDVISIENYPVEHETEFGGIYIKISIDDFNSLGFQYGDSVDVLFSNGYTLEDIPYYNGYYVDAGQPLLIAYPGYAYIKAAVNYGEDLWETAGLKSELRVSLWAQSGTDEHSTATVRLREQGKYLDIQQARDISYSDDRTKYPSDEVFANFRSVSVGNIPDGVFYRSASPCDNQHQRAAYVDDLIEEAGVKAILNLSDNEAKIEGYISREDFDSPYFLSLYEDGKVIPVGLSMNYLSTEFASRIADGFIALTATDGPFLVHCTEGKDRTGFVCMLIEALAGASYQEIADDYMLTYDNYYEITREKDRAKYDTILEKNLDAMLKTVVGDETVDIKSADLAPYARQYLVRAGMTEEEVDAFLNRIT